MALNLIPRLPSLSVLAAADNVCRIDLTVLFPDCASIEIGVPPNQPHSVDVQPSTIYVTVSGPTVTVPPHSDHTHGPGAGGSVWPVTTTCDEEGLVTAMPIPTGSPSGPGGPGSGGPGSGGPGSGGPGSGGPGSGGPGNGGPGSGNNGPGNGNNGPGSGNNGPGSGNNGPGSGNNNPSPSSTTTLTTLSTLTTAIRTSLPTPTTTSCPLPPFLSISTTLADLLDLDLKLYLDLSSLTSGVSSLLDSVSNLLGADNRPASPSNLPTTQVSRFRTLPCGTSLGSLPGGNTTTIPINNNTDGPDGGNGNGNGNGDNNSGGSSAIEECIQRCEQDAIRASLELLNIRDCLGVTVDRTTTVDNCLWFVGPRGEKLPVLDLGVVVDLTGLLGEGVESAVRDD
ncbi:hypothetical protein NEUTE1DRAFT_133026 [Neurospora tetrasperma FGSC 2508]|uniref:Uncharacterized protein n=1 Tax=Neurospora tetrasperma (strain FGSC 2508 / ATCC MYA-4615 / P0657) TaxID=510951 RepID=F8N1L8_NEUT8|nr:uncharacterized protein NEUTE1DRAFT_133026 [Neurospora tetrasperma FGSC 2508]EGO52349.1 hypothetical protein NEUTE1DRAFT_133026 [Neurospora tetrasperma FGSC 2508]